MTESCLAGVQKVFGPRGQESPKSHLCLGKQGLRPCNPMLRHCNKPFVPMSAKTFCALSKALWARSADLISVPGGLVCDVSTELNESFHRPTESQTRVSKGVPQECRNWRVQGNSPTLRQPCANPSPTLRQPFANPLPTFSADPSPTPSFRGPQAPV